MTLQRISCFGYNGACAMNGNQVNQIVADAYNHIWIDTNQKLIEFNPRNGSFRTYLTTDGSILLHRFLPTAVCQAKRWQYLLGSAFRVFAWLLHQTGWKTKG